VQGKAMLKEAFARAEDAGYHDHAARALINLSYVAAAAEGLDEAEPMVERTIAHAREHELGGYLQYALGVRAMLRVLRGNWAAAEADAHASLERGKYPGISLCPALVALGTLQARRGDPAATATLDEAWERAVASGELQRLGPAAAARLELAWLEGTEPPALAETREIYARAVATADPFTLGELAFRLWLVGELDEVPPAVAAPYRLAAAGDWSEAAAAWAAMGRPYDAAEARGLADDEDALLQALAELDRLGAAPAAARLRRLLRERGVAAVPRGPRPATRALPRGLTPRQVEVLALIATGATNAEIVERLVVSPKTVDHHVSAVLAKLAVGSRREAASVAVELGIVPAEAGEAPAPT
jgi:DNA-binding CsgD family transcriptional regulator